MRCAALEAPTRFHLYEEVHVAARIRLTSLHRSEDANVSHTMALCDRKNLASRRLQLL